jgi:hypothetical protein
MKTALVLFFLSIATAECRAQDRLAEMLRQGIIAEETRQDLNAAIQAYQSVLARYGEDRATAAAALFRLAEAYRKQGKADLAAAAYKRLGQEFADQRELVKLSRSRLGNNVAPAGALRKYRSILEQEIGIAEQSLKLVQREMELGAMSPSDIRQTESQLIRLQTELAAFDAGLFPVQPAAPDTPEAKRARDQYRKLLQAQLELAAKDLEQEKKNYDLGTSRRQVVIQKQIRLLELQRELAAFEAGLAARPRSEIEFR